MKILLRADVKGVGRKNEIREVSPGYANNFLFPKKLAVVATDEVLKKHDEQIRKHAQEEGETKKHLEELAKRFAGRSLIFPVKTNEEGTVFGSVTKEMILSGLRGEHFITKEHVDIKIEHPLKALGDYTIEIDLKKGVTAQLKVTLQPLEENV